MIKITLDDQAQTEIHNLTTALTAAGDKQLSAREVLGAVLLMNAGGLEDPLAGKLGGEFEAKVADDKLDELKAALQQVRDAAKAKKVALSRHGRDPHAASAWVDDELKAVNRRHGGD